MKGRSLCWFGG